MTTGIVVHFPKQLRHASRPLAAGQELFLGAKDGTKTIGITFDGDDAGIAKRHVAIKAQPAPDGVDCYVEVHNLSHRRSVSLVENDGTEVRIDPCHRRMLSCTTRVILHGDNSHNGKWLEYEVAVEMPPDYDRSTTARDRRKAPETALSGETGIDALREALTPLQWSTLVAYCEPLLLGRSNPADDVAAALRLKLGARGRATASKRVHDALARLRLQHAGWDLDTKEALCRFAVRRGAVVFADLEVLDDAIRLGRTIGRSRGR